MQPSLTSPSRSRMAELRSAKVSNSPTLPGTKGQAAERRAGQGSGGVGKALRERQRFPCRASYLGLLTGDRVARK